MLDKDIYYRGEIQEDLDPEQFGWSWVAGHDHPDPMTFDGLDYYARSDFDHVLGYWTNYENGELDSIIVCEKQNVGHLGHMSQLGFDRVRELLSDPEARAQFQHSDTVLAWGSECEQVQDHTVMHIGVREAWGEQGTDPRDHFREHPEETADCTPECLVVWPEIAFGVTHLNPITDHDPGRYADEMDPEAQNRAIEAEAVERDGQDAGFCSGMGQ